MEGASLVPPPSLVDAYAAGVVQARVPTRSSAPVADIAGDEDDIVTVG